MMQDQYGPWRRVIIAERVDQHAYVNLETNICHLTLPAELDSVWGTSASVIADDVSSTNETPIFTHNKNFIVNTNTSFSDVDLNSPTARFRQSLGESPQTPVATIPVANQETNTSTFTAPTKPAPARTGYVRVDTLPGWHIMYSYDYNRIYFNSVTDTSRTLWEIPPGIKEADVANIENRFRASLNRSSVNTGLPPPARGASASVSREKDSSLVNLPEIDLDESADESFAHDGSSSETRFMDNLSTPRSMIVHSPNSPEIAVLSTLPNFEEEDEEAGATAAAAVRLVVSVGEQNQSQNNLSFQFHGNAPLTSSLTLDTSRNSFSRNSTSSQPPPFHGIPNSSSGQPLTPSTAPPPFNPSAFRSSSANAADYTANTSFSSPQPPAHTTSGAPISLASPRPPSGPPPVRSSRDGTDSGRNSFNDNAFSSFSTTQGLGSPRPPPFTPISGSNHARSSSTVSAPYPPLTPSGHSSFNQFIPSSTASPPTISTSGISPAPPAGPRPPAMARSSAPNSAYSTLRGTRNSDVGGLPIPEEFSETSSQFFSSTMSPVPAPTTSRPDTTGPLSRSDVSSLLNDRLRMSISMGMPPGLVRPISNSVSGPPLHTTSAPLPSVSAVGVLPIASGPRLLADDVAEIVKMTHITYNGPCEKRTSGLSRRQLNPRYLRIEDGILSHWTSFMEVTVAEGKPRGFMSVVGSSIHLAPANTGIQPERGFELSGLRGGKERMRYQVQFVHAEECEAWVYALVRNGAADCRYPLLAADIFIGKGRKLQHALLYHDRIQVFTASTEVATGTPTQVISFTRNATITNNSNETNSIFLDVPECLIRDLKSMSHPIGFEDLDTMQLWTSTISKSIRGPLGVVFGGELSHLAKISPYVVPEVVHLCIQRLLAVGLQEEGLLRVPGSDMQISEIKNAFNNCTHSVKDSLKDPNTVAGVLKVFFRELMDSVVPMQKYEAFTSLDCRNGNDAALAEKALRMKDLIEDLPRENQYCLNYVIYLLTQISAFAATNKMNAKNCAMVLAPGLLRSPISNDNDLRSFSKMSEQEAVIEVMINNYNTIFPRGPPYKADHPVSIPKPKSLTKKPSPPSAAAGPPPPGPPPPGATRLGKSNSSVAKDGNNGGPVFD